MNLTPSPPEINSLRPNPILQDAGIDVLGDASTDSAEKNLWKITKSEHLIQNHLAMREDDYQRLVSRHHKQDEKIEKLTYDLGTAQSTGRCTTLLGLFSGTIAALIPALSIFIPQIKNVASVETLGMTGGIIAGVLLPLAVWQSGRKRKSNPSD